MRSRFYTSTAQNIISQISLGLLALVLFAPDIAVVLYRCCWLAVGFHPGVVRVLAMAGLAQTMMSCTVVKGNALSFMGSALSGSSFAPSQGGRLVAVPSKICAVKSPEECNEEECAPTKEVGKLSLDWKTEDNSKVAGTYPPLARQERKWTGYVEKDTAGQTNIYAVEPTIYVAESAISTGTAGGASGGSGEALAVAGGLGLIAVASAASILLSVGKNAPAPQTAYVGPPLTYYVSKFSSEVAAPASVAEQISTTSESPSLADLPSVPNPEAALSEATGFVQQQASEVVSDVKSTVTQ